jgi:HD-GYP domain-containing protein (c-di-GMP phosphodiesterase class II)
MENNDLPATPIIDLVLCISEAVDLVSPLVADHHRRTAQIAYGLARKAHLPEPLLRDIVIAAALHDVGGLTKQDRLGALDFEYQDPYGHPVRGYLLLNTFHPLESAANIVRFHHVPWRNGRGRILDGVPVSIYSHLIHLADRIAVLIDPDSEILNQVGDIQERINEQSGDRFHPDWVRVFNELSGRESFWLDSVYYLSLNTLRRRVDWPKTTITDEDFDGLSNLFRRIIDFRSHYTASHSAGVAACAAELGRLTGHSQTECHLLHLAGLLHDLGKLAVPTEILEKPGKLTQDEYDVVRRHTYHTFCIMETLQMLDVVRIWGAYHHERMDGQGYPFHLSETDLPLESRIVTVADIFSALTENRPYRAGMSPDKALEILVASSNENQVDKDVVHVLQTNLEHMDAVRKQAQVSADQEYRDFIEMAEKLTPIVPD